ncbi:MAG: AMP-binding protein [Piscinibacter sp.]|uniref:AMP-binding protein n=1 Tax=Piscinibacter sp. TaxID=1903157 RepID=UPI002CAEA70A|nr:AMP-binding protein [Accumulibacter sp.]HPL79488.1 AMP-binding protein [Burkholderiaceae bacterium]
MNLTTDFFSDPTRLAPRRTVRTNLPGGGFTLQHPEPLAPYARCVGEWLEHWARETPESIAFAEPNTAAASAASSAWSTLTWAGLRARVGAVAQSLLDLKLAPGRPIVVLSDNSLEHLVLMLAGMPSPGSSASYGQRSARSRWAASGPPTCSRSSRT